MNTRYEVEWCYDLPTTEHETLIDEAKYHAEYHRTLDAAIKRAKEVLPLDCFGAVRIQEQERTLDQYITEDIGRAYHTWEDVRTMHVEDEAHTYTEADFESRY